MKRFPLSLLFLAFYAVVLTAQQSEKHHRATIHLDGRSPGEIEALGIEADHGHIEPGSSLTNDFSDSEIALLRHQGFRVDILIEDVSAWYVAHSKDLVALPRSGDCSGGGTQTFDYQTPANYQPGTIAGYFRYQEMLDNLDAMRTKYPNLISARAKVSETLVTHEGRPQWWVRVSDNPDAIENEPELLYTSVLHAREMNSLSQMIFYLWYLLDNYDSDPEVRYIVDNTAMYFIPCVNPDGYLFNESENPDGGGLWRKNRRANTNGTFGVDLNRNFGHQWNFNNQGSSGNQGAETYRGPAAFSEPETQMVRDFCLAHNFKIALNYHTYSNLLISPWGYSDQLADPAFKHLSKVLTRENHFTTGTGSQTVGYTVNGGSDDWMYAERGTLAMTPEVGPINYGFWPPESAIDFLNKSNMWQNVSAALCLLRFGVAYDQSEQFFTTKNFQLPVNVIRYGFEAGPLTVSLAPLSANVAAVGPTQVFDLAHFEETNTNFDVSLDPGITAGEEFSLLLSLSNGTLTWTDTLRKTFGINTLALFDEPAANLNNWDQENWGLNSATFVSAPTSITDSPNGDYDDGAINILTLKNPVFIPANVMQPTLNFFAKWSIEADFDFVQVQASNDNLNWVALCGLYTNPGINDQPKDEPLFDGNQTAWVEECMDLQPFAGGNVWLRFVLFSDEFQNFDGFYFDDLKIQFLQLLGSRQISLTDFVLEQNQPNPSSDATTIRWTNDGRVSGKAKLLIFNVFGQKIEERAVQLYGQNFQKIETSGWPAGAYFYQIQSPEGVSEIRKMVVGG